MQKGILDENTGHEWDKVNLVTQMGRDGMYDTWQCIHCKKKFKRYGVRWSPPQEPCKKNAAQQSVHRTSGHVCPFCGKPTNNNMPAHFMGDPACR